MGLGLMPEYGPMFQLAIIKLVTIFDAAKTIVEAEANARAIAESVGRPAPMGGHDYNVLWQNFCHHYPD